MDICQFLTIRSGTLSRKKKLIAWMLSCFMLVGLCFGPMIHTSDAQRMMAMAQSAMTSVQDRLNSALFTSADASLHRALQGTSEVKGLISASVQLLSLSNLKLPEQTVSKIVRSIDQIYSDVLSASPHVQSPITSELAKAKGFVTILQHMSGDSSRDFSHNRSVGVPLQQLGGGHSSSSTIAVNMPYQSEIGWGGQRSSQQHSIEGAALSQTTTPLLPWGIGSNSFLAGTQQFLSQSSALPTPVRAPIPAAASLAVPHSSAYRAEGLVHRTELPLAGTYARCSGARTGQEGVSLSRAASLDSSGLVSSSQPRKRRRLTESAEVRAQPQTFFSVEQSVAVQDFSALQVPVVPVVPVQANSSPMPAPVSPRRSNTVSRKASLDTIALTTQEDQKMLHYQCMSCSMRVRSKEVLGRHVRNAHLESSLTFAHRCGHCEFSFASNLKRGEFLTHLREEHPETLYLCPQCPERFMARSDLDNHGQVHGQHGPHKCFYCTASFFNYAHLVGHFKRAHEDRTTGHQIVSDSENLPIEGSGLLSADSEPSRALMNDGATDSSEVTNDPQDSQSSRGVNREKSPSLADSTALSLGSRTQQLEEPSSTDNAGSSEVLATDQQGLPMSAADVLDFSLSSGMLSGLENQEDPLLDGFDWMGDLDPALNGSQTPLSLSLSLPDVLDASSLDLFQCDQNLDFQRQQEGGVCFESDSVRAREGARLLDQSRSDHIELVNSASSLPCPDLCEGDPSSSSSSHPPHQLNTAERPAGPRSSILSVKETGKGKHCQCKWCSKCFTRKNHLRSHNKKFHPDSAQEEFRCAYCKSFFSLDNATLFLNHLRREHRDKLFVCRMCSKGFERLSLLETHVRRHKGEKRYACPRPQCSQGFVDLCELRSHLQGGHGLQTPDNWKEAYGVVRASSASSSHLHSTHSLNVSPSSRLNPPPTVHPTIASPDTLLNHREKKGLHYRCKLCKKQLFDRTNVLDHIKRVHSESERKYLCSYCSETFDIADSSKLFSKHLKEKHREKIFICDGCGNAYLENAKLERHRTGSTAEGKKYECQLCQEMLESSCRLAEHLRKNHKLCLQHGWMTMYAKIKLSARA